MDEEGYSTLEVRRRAVGAVLRGRLMVDVADAYDTDRSTVFHWVRRYQQVERQYYEIDAGARQKWNRYEVPKFRKTVEKYRAILYFQDEANVSLTAFLGKTWSPCGRTPKAKVTGKRGGVAAMSAISRRGHLLFRLHNKQIASPEVIDFLKQMLKHHPLRHLVVVMDQASFADSFSDAVLQIYSDEPYASIDSAVIQMGQTLFEPPNVGGIISTASGALTGVVEYGLCEGGHFEGAAEAVAETGEGTDAWLLRCLQQRGKRAVGIECSWASAYYGPSAAFRTSDPNSPARRQRANSYPNRAPRPR